MKTPRKRKAPSPGVPEPELLLEARAAMLVEASMPGALDADVARKWGIATKTIQRARIAAETDPEFRKALAKAWKKIDPYEDIKRALSMLIRKATELAALSRSPKDLRQIRDLIACLGEILVSRDALVPKDQEAPVEADREDPSPAADSKSP